MFILMVILLLVQLFLQRLNEVLPFDLKMLFEVESRVVLRHALFRDKPPEEAAHLVGRANARLVEESRFLMNENW